MDLKELVQGYERNMKALDKALTKLETEAQTIQEQQQQRKASRERVDALQRKRANLASERESLRGEYAEASFEGDEDELERITDRREDIDAQLTKLTEDINAERASMPEVDSTQAVNVAVQRDMLKPINVQTFLDKLAETLKEDADVVNRRIRSISVDSSTYRRGEYDRIRAGKDSSFASSLAREKRLAAKDAERQAKLRPISNTSDMADALGTRRRPEDRMKWTAKGEKGESLERAAYTEETSGVLSGPEVAKILAEKQARKAG